MYKIKADSARNRLYIFLYNSEEIDMPEFVAGIEKACSEVMPGFFCILLLSEDLLSNAKAQWTIYYTENLLYAYGLSKIVHVTEKKNGSVSCIEDELSFIPQFIMEKVRTIQEAEEIFTNN